MNTEVKLIMRKLSALTALILMMMLLSSGACSAKERFVTFPALGMCNGTYVRYRDNPDTEGEILGRLNFPERVIVLGSTATDGQVWYEIEDPHSDNTAFVFGKYVEPVYNETLQQSEPYKMLVNIIQTYGITREKAEFYDGAKADTSYKGADGLVRVRARHKGCNFGDVKIGDDTERLREVLGDPDVENDNGAEWVYKVDDVSLSFLFDDGKIYEMVYEN